MGAEEWDTRLAAATDALDVASGKPLGTFSHYRGERSEPTLAHPDGQPRSVVRIQYSRADGLVIHSHYADTGKTFTFKPKGTDATERPAGVSCFDYEKKK